MNKKSIYLIAISLITVFSIIFGTYINVFYKNQTMDTKHHTETIKNNGINNISVELSSRNVEIRQGDSFKVDYYGSSPSIVGDGDTLQIYEKNKKNNINFNFSFNTKSWAEDTIIVFVPSDAEFNNISIKTDSGDVRLFAGNADKLKINTDTGDLTIDGLTAKNIKLNVDSGDIKINDTESSDINAKADSGDVNLDNVAAKDMDIKVDSGDIYVKNSSGSKIKARSEYGDIRLKKSDFKEKDISASNGDVSY